MQPTSPTSSSRVIIANKTAFPINIAFLYKAVPLHHTNTLEPGDTWASPAPSAPIMNTPKLPRDLISYLSQKLAYPTNSPLITTMEVRFDHDHNRFSTEATRRLRTRAMLCFVMRIVGIITLLSGSALGVFTSLFGPYSARFRHSGVWMLQDDDVGIALHTSSNTHLPYMMPLAVSIVGLLLLLFSYYLQLDSPPPPLKSCSLPGRTPLLCIRLPTHVLASPYHSTNSTVSRSDRHLEICWQQGRLALWDADRGYEIVGV